MLSQTHVCCPQQLRMLAFTSPTTQTVRASEGFVSSVGNCYPHSPCSLMETSHPLLLQKNLLENKVQMLYRTISLPRGRSMLSSTTPSHVEAVAHLLETGGRGGHFEQQAGQSLRNTNHTYQLSAVLRGRQPPTLCTPCSPACNLPGTVLSFRGALTALPNAEDALGTL